VKFSAQERSWAIGGTAEDDLLLKAQGVISCSKFRALLPLGDWIARWSQLFLEFALNQGLAQAAGMISGLIYVRLMPVDQYALYAMGLASLAFLSIGSDMGLMGSLSYFWRQSGKVSSAIEPKIAAVRRLRWVFLLVASLVSGALLLKTAAKQHLPLIAVLTCFGVVVATASSNLRATIDLHVMRLRGMQRKSYYCEAAGSIIRLSVAIAMIATGITTALFGLAGQLLGALSMLVAVGRFAPNPKKGSQPIGIETWREVLSYIIPVFPTTIVYMVTDPLVLWLALTFGGQSTISETFAVGRIAAIYGLLFGFIVVVVEPRLAGIKDEARFARMMGLFLLALILLSAAVTMVAHLAPSALLLLIGPKYAHLQIQVVLSIVASSFWLITTFLSITNRIRGWVRLEPVTAACQAIAVIVLASRWSFHDSTSVLWLSVVLAACNCLWFLMTSIVGLLVPTIVKAR
jgi:O-antigen/teichoic acid export membrane protein